MAKKPQDEGGTLTESCKPAVHLDPDLASVRRSRIPEMLFDVAMASLFGVQIRRIGWEPFQLNLGVCINILPDDHGSMRVQTVPDDDHWPCDVPLKVAEGDKNISGADAMLKMALVDFAGQRQANHRGQLAAFAHALEDGRLPLWGPGGACLSAKGKAGLIDEDDFRASSASLFLMRGQSRMSQAWTRASSRSRA
jgi:hypothetical protein